MTFGTHRSVTGRQHKEFSAPLVYIDAPTRQATFVISDGNVDRDDDVLDPRGALLSEYMANGVMLYGHDASALPIAKLVSGPVVVGDQLRATFEFATADLNPLADSCYKMVKGGFLSATSVGFLPVEYTARGDGEGYRFTKWTLLEVSLVPVPSNARALLVEVKSLGIDVAPFKAFKAGPFDRTDQEDPPCPLDDDEVSHALDQFEMRRSTGDFMTKEQFRNRLEFYRLKGGSNELTASRLKTIVDREFTKAATKAGFTGDGGTPGYSAQPVTETGPLATENELTIDRVRAILEAQGITGAELAEILGLLGADIGDGANLAGGANIGGPGPAGQPVNTEPQIASYTDRIKAAARN